jgi:hypothetical protein
MTLREDISSVHIVAIQLNLNHLPHILITSSVTQTALFRASPVTLFLPPMVRSVVCESQRELTCCLPFPSCFLHNPKFAKPIPLLATFCAGFLIGIFFDPDDEGNMLLRKGGSLSAGYMVLYHRRQTLYNRCCESL